MTTDGGFFLTGFSVRAWGEPGDLFLGKTDSSGNLARMRVFESATTSGVGNVVVEAANDGSSAVIIIKDGAVAIEIDTDGEGQVDGVLRTTWEDSSDRLCGRTSAAAAGGRSCWFSVGVSSGRGS